jgi:hypothetical protein
MKHLLLLGALLTFSTPVFAYHDDIDYIPGTIPGCDRINGVYVCQDGRGNRWIPIPKERRRYYRQLPLACGSQTLVILGIPLLSSTECL